MQDKGPFKPKHTLQGGKVHSGAGELGKSPGFKGNAEVLASIKSGNK